MVLSKSVPGDGEEISPVYSTQKNYILHRLHRTMDIDVSHFQMVRSKPRNLNHLASAFFICFAINVLWSTKREVPTLLGYRHSFCLSSSLIVLKISRKVKPDFQRLNFEQPTGAYIKLLLEDFSGSATRSPTRVLHEIRSGRWVVLTRFLTYSEAPRARQRRPTQLRKFGHLSIRENLVVT